MKIRILKERKLTKAEKDKREEVAKAIEKENPDMPMDKKMAIATAQAKKKEEQLDETSTMVSGGVEGGIPISDKKTLRRFNKQQEKEQRLKGEKLAEMFSTSTQSGGIRISIISAEKVHAGHVERSQHQGLMNVMREDDDDTEPLQGFDSDRGAGQGTIWKLSDFADNSRNASRTFDVLKDVEENIGLIKLGRAILLDKSAKNRTEIMSSKFGYDQDLYERIEKTDQEAIKKYYQFLINEFLFWIAYNPMSSAQQYAGRDGMLSKPTKDLAYAHIHRYVSNPNQNNPKDLGDRISKQADFYELEKDLDPALYDLPEE